MRDNPDFPDRVVCNGVPSQDGQTVELRAPTEEGQPQGMEFSVSVDDITWVGMPTAIVACRIVERQTGYLIVAVPALTGSRRISVRPGNIARPRHSEQKGTTHVP